MPAGSRDLDRAMRSVGGRCVEGAPIAEVLAVRRLGGGRPPCEVLVDLVSPSAMVQVSAASMARISTSVGMRMPIRSASWKATPMLAVARERRVCTAQA